MVEPVSPSIRREAIKNKACELFSAGTLTEKTQLAFDLASLPGLDLYPSALPWLIRIGQGQPILGLSENLHQAARDIHANLISLGRQYPLDAQVSVDVDEARLPIPRAGQFLRKLEGG